MLSLHENQVLSLQYSASQHFINMWTKFFKKHLQIGKEKEKLFFYFCFRVIWRNLVLRLLPILYRNRAILDKILQAYKLRPNIFAITFPVSEDKYKKCNFRKKEKSTFNIPQGSVLGPLLFITSGSIFYTYFHLYKMLSVQKLFRTRQTKIRNVMSERKKEHI